MSAFRGWAESRAAGFSGLLAFDEPMAKHTYYRIGGPAAALASPRTREDLAWLRKGIEATGVRHFVLGMGSNLLVSDSGFEGLVVKCGRLNLEIEPVAQDRVRVGASVAISSLLRRAVAEGWAGLQFLTGIPGSMGGVVFMNGGTHLGELKDRVRHVSAVSLKGGAESLEFEGGDMGFEYRRNRFLPEGAVVWSAELQVERDDPAKVKATIDEVLARRKATQPIDLPSCGSVFKNPAGHSAWAVLDRLGLRGHRVGGAQVSEKHSNFIVNQGGAKAADVRAIIELAKSRAKAELGIELEEEVRYLGEFSSSRGTRG